MTIDVFLIVSIDLPFIVMKLNEVELELDSEISSKNCQELPQPKLSHPQQDEDKMKHRRLGLDAFFDTTRKLKDNTNFH